jgi:protein-S-isoprenylcysteine O-methyltransferase Ste14
LAYLALGIATISVISLILFFFIFLGYNHIANFEERKLEQAFGDEYIDYKQRVGKWIPKL